MGGAIWQDIALGAAGGIVSVLAVFVVMLRVFVLQRANLRGPRRRIVIRGGSPCDINVDECVTDNDHECPLKSGKTDGSNSKDGASCETAAWLEGILRTLCAAAARSQGVRMAIERAAAGADAALSAAMASGESGVCLSPVRVSELEIDAGRLGLRIPCVQALPSAAEATVELTGGKEGHILSVTIETGVCVGNPAMPVAVLPCTFRVLMHSLRCRVLLDCVAEAVPETPMGGALDEKVRKRHVPGSRKSTESAYKTGHTALVVRRDGFEIDMEVRSAIGARAQLRDAARVADVMHAAIRTAIMSHLEPCRHVLFEI